MAKSRGRAVGRRTTRKSGGAKKGASGKVKSQRSATAQRAKG
ncbi:hypothetical protein [Flammeovirga agarivorans]|nr:hypothetical protein [Flammeovirga agarivorans]